MQMYSEADVDATCLADRQVTILGYGSQGRAHALNLKDSGFNVVMGLRRMARAGRRPSRRSRGEGARRGGQRRRDRGVPDPGHGAEEALYAAVVDAIPEGAALLFAHGFAVHFGQIEPRADLDVVLIAPKGPGDLVRRQYEEGHGVPCLVAVAPGRHRQCAQARPGLCRRHRRRPGRRHRDDLRRGNRDGPVRRAGRALRRRDRADRRRLRDAGRSRAISRKSPITKSCTS